MCITTAEKETLTRTGLQHTHTHTHSTFNGNSHVLQDVGSKYQVCEKFVNSLMYI